MKRFTIDPFRLNPAQLAVFEQLVALALQRADFISRSQISADMGGEAGEQVYASAAAEKQTAIDEIYAVADDIVKAAFCAWEQAPEAVEIPPEVTPAAE